VKSAVETISATRVRISIDVDFNDLEPHVKRAYQSISAQEEYYQGSIGKHAAASRSQERA
jgi:hypothetical protein